MSIIQGIDDVWTVESTEGQASDQLPIVAAASGLRLMGFTAKWPTDSIGSLLDIDIRVGSANTGGPLIASAVMVTAERVVIATFGREGLDCTGGLVVDYNSSNGETFDLAIYTKTVT